MIIKLYGAQHHNTHGLVRDIEYFHYEPRRSETLRERAKQQFPTWRQWQWNGRSIDALINKNNERYTKREREKRR